MTERGMRMGQKKPAGFWMRFLATLIDGIFMSVLTWIIGILINDTTTDQLQQSYYQSPGSVGASFEYVMSPSEITANLIYVIVFIIIFTATQYKGSPGKLICRIQVVNPDMSKISIGKSIGRYFSYILSGIILLVGFMMAGWNKEKKALHDMICNTRVVYKDKDI